MTDYSKLADQAQAAQQAARLTALRERDAEQTARNFFRLTGNCVMDEMEQANLELERRKSPTIGRNFVPNFPGSLFLTCGTEAMCRVDLLLQKNGFRITAILSGPIGYERSRTEYQLEMQPPADGSTAWTVTGGTSEAIARSIVAGIVADSFKSR